MSSYRAVKVSLTTMRFLRSLPLLFLACGACAQAPTARVQGPRCVEGISDAEAADMGRRIWMLEGGGKILAWWDDTGECSSFGINNYLWFHKDLKVPFEESFPPLIDFMLSKGADVPQWLRSKPPAPWKTRAEFFGETVAPEKIRKSPPDKWGMKPEQFAADDSPRMKELKDFLAKTVDLQARFSAQRMVDSLPKMLAVVPEGERARVESQFYRVACSHGGLFNLVDYVNFKGEGVNPKETYPSVTEPGKFVHWGLPQVLQGMTGDAAGPTALDAFADSAEAVMHNRVVHAPPERAEGDRRWEKSWIARIQNYRPR